MPRFSHGTIFAVRLPFRRLAPSLLAVFLLLIAQIAMAWADGQDGDQLIETARTAGGDVVPYVLTTSGLRNAETIVILMPGGHGQLDPRVVDGQLVSDLAGNFLIRSRALFADDRTVALSTNATSDADRMGAIVADALQRFPHARVFIIGTSRSTLATMDLAVSMDGRVAGFVHSSSMRGIADFDTRPLKSRQLIVHHANDQCRETPYDAALANHERYGTPMITMTGGITKGNPCQAKAFHGYDGIEAETVGRIKDWIARESTPSR
jgi:hypothetical protein